MDRMGRTTFGYGAFSYVLKDQAKEKTMMLAHHRLKTI